MTPSDRLGLLLSREPRPASLDYWRDLAGLNGKPALTEEERRFLPEEGRKRLAEVEGGR